MCVHARLTWLSPALRVCVCVCFQEFHYRPRASDTCLPCDCYPVGSFSRSCDPESGQCQCRPGVIGRQCNSCDNPFAEVTNSGCEGRISAMWGFPKKLKIKKMLLGDEAMLGVFVPSAVCFAQQPYVRTCRRNKCDGDYS